MVGSVLPLVRYETEINEAESFTDNEEKSSCRLQPTPGSPVPVHTPAMQRTPPAPGWVTINFDTAYFEAIGDSWCGAIT